MLNILIICYLLQADPTEAPLAVDVTAYTAAHNATKAAKLALRKVQHNRNHTSAEYTSAKVAYDAAKEAEALLEAQYRADLVTREAATK